MRQGIQALVIGAVLLTAPAVFAADYTIDPNHTTFGFTVQHMMISNVSGNFGTFSGDVSYDPKDLSQAKANIKIDVASIDTHVAKRDAHLKSPDFFDAAKYPEITFVSTKFTPTSITGNLTMKGLTQEVTIPVTISGPVNEMGHQAIGITGSTTINRQNWGIAWNKNLDTGGVVVSDNVTLNISIEADAK
jgi:polyisoprenoid-binding protein YceI